MSELNDPFEFAPYYDAHASPERALAVVNTNREYVAVQGLTALYESHPEWHEYHTVDDFRNIAINKHPDAILKLMANATPQALNETDANMPDARKRRLELLNENLGILCLTEKADNLLMWAHYTRDHTGFVIEFDAEHPYFADARHAPVGVDCMTKVSYTTMRPYSHYLTDISKQELYFVKSSEWQYEQEWRLLKLLSQADVIPVAGIHLFNIPHDCITTVILGCRSSDKLASDIAKLLNDQAELSHIELKKAKMQDRYYGLDISRILPLLSRHEADVARIV